MDVAGLLGSDKVKGLGAWEKCYLTSHLLVGFDVYV